MYSSIFCDCDFIKKNKIQNSIICFKSHMIEKIQRQLKNRYQLYKYKANSLKVFWKKGAFFYLNLEELNYLIE